MILYHVCVPIVGVVKIPVYGYTQKQALQAAWRMSESDIAEFAIDHLDKESVRIRPPKEKWTAEEEGFVR